MTPLSAGSSDLRTSGTTLTLRAALSAAHRVEESGILVLVDELELPDRTVDLRFTVLRVTPGQPRRLSGFDQLDALGAAAVIDRMLANTGLGDLLAHDPTGSNP